MGSLILGGSYRSTTSTYDVMSVLKSTDEGVTWDRCDFSTLWGATLSLLIDPNDSNIMYAGGWYEDESLYRRSGLFKTTNGGMDWVDISGPIEYTIYTLCFDPFNNSIIYAGSAWGGVYKSTDAGSSWTTTDFTGSVFALAADPDTPDRVFSGTSSGVFVSEDGGTSWESMNDGLEYDDIRCIEFDPVSNNLYVGTQGGGVFLRSLGTRVESENENSLQPDRCTLYQNHPNPFNSTTVIRYKLGTGGAVNLSIYDLNGRLVRILKETHQAAGIWDVDWNGVDLNGRKVSSGLYICKLQIEDHIKMKKIILQK